MDNRDHSLYERLIFMAGAKAKEYKAPIIMTWVIGLMAHMFMFTNKLLNPDEVASLFGKGATLQSGRWLLGLTGYIFPNFSMPWIYGIISLTLISITVCLIVRIFSIRNRFLQGLLAGVIVCFPGQVSIYCFMFTSAPYALSFLLSVLSVYVTAIGTKPRKYLISAVILALTCGIYQSYTAMAASLYVILLIVQLLRGESARDVFLRAVQYLAVLLIALGLYYGITLCVCRITGTELLDYAYSGDSILFRILLAYNGFIRSLVSGYFGFITGTLSLAAHIVCIAVGGMLILSFIAGEKKPLEAALLLVLIFLLPLSINCLYLISETGIISSWTQYSFVCVYIFGVAVADTLCGERRVMRDAVLFSMTAIILCNIFFANRVYLKLHLDYENASSFYSVLVSDIRKDSEYEDGMTVYLAGTAENGDWATEAFGLERFNGPAADFLNTYTKPAFIRYYIGDSMKILPFEEYQIRRMLEDTEEYSRMPAYPAEGSIAEIDGYLVVRLG